MISSSIKIENIPAILWGKSSSEIMIAVHGNMSSKSDLPIVVLAEELTPRGYQVLSFDLPAHGDRKEEAAPCKVEYYLSDLEKIITFAKTRSNSISLMANSMGAYFSLLIKKNL